MSSEPGRIHGPDPKPDPPALRAALAMARAAARRPTDDDRPPPSTFPMTPAARAAKQLSRGKLRA